MSALIRIMSTLIRIMSTVIRIMSALIRIMSTETRSHAAHLPHMHESSKAQQHLRTHAL